MTETNIDILENRAREQRKQIHNSVQQLRSTVKEKLDPKRNARQYFPQLGTVAAVIGLSAGYLVGGIFAD